MSLNERPLLTRVSIGDEPVHNRIMGVDFAYDRDSRFITKAVDAMPLIHTKEMSHLKLNGEAAVFIPGVNKVVGENGNAFLDGLKAQKTPMI